jgi:hypothetical protein
MKTLRILALAAIVAQIGGPVVAADMFPPASACTNPDALTQNTSTTGCAPALLVKSSQTISDPCGKGGTVSGYVYSVERASDGSGATEIVLQCADGTGRAIVLKHQPAKRDN